MKLHPHPNLSRNDPYQESPVEMHLFHMIPVSSDPLGGEASPPLHPLEVLEQHGGYCDLCRGTMAIDKPLVVTPWGTVECLQCIVQAFDYR